MVAIITNPTYTGGLTDPGGQNIGQAMNGIAGAFMNTAQGDAARLAMQQAQQKQAATNNIASAFTKYGDAQQDYQQDAPDYKTPQPAPGLSLADPESFNRSLLTLGDPGTIGKTLQLSSAMQGGGINAPGVAVGSLPSATYGETPEGKGVANQQAMQLAAQKAELDKKQTPYNVSWMDATGQQHNMVSTDPATDIANMGIADKNPKVGSAAGGQIINVNGEQSSFSSGLGTGLSKEVLNKMNAGDSAIPVLESTNEAMAALSGMMQHGGTTGIGAQTLVNIRNAANTAASSLAGTPVTPFGDLTDAGVFTKATNAIAMNSLKQLVQGAGGRITNMEVTMFKAANPGWDLTPGGNMKMLQLINQAAQRDQQLGQGLRQIVAGAAQKGAQPNPADFINFEQNHFATHHLLDPVNGTDYTEMGAQQSAQQPAQAGVAPQAGSAPVAGAKQASDGHWYVSDPARPGKYLQVQQ
jgi:hypothetical protein